MDQMGLAPRDDAAGVRWVAVRHGQSSGGIDHVHIVATLARQDGALPSVHNDYARARKACLAIEKRFGLHATAAADCTAAPRPSRAETEQAHRTGRSEPPRVTLRRIVQDAATAVSENDFFARLREAGVLVRVRHSTARPGETTGYAVSLPAEKAGTRQAIWFSGGKLAPDLTLPKLRKRWSSPELVGRLPVNLHPAERRAAWAGVIKLTEDGATHLRCLATSNPAAASDAAWATADALRASAQAIGGAPGRQIRRAADHFDRAARATYRTIPQQTATGNELRTASRLLAAFSSAGSGGVRIDRLIISLIRLAEETARFRLIQGQAHQAKAAKQAAEQLAVLHRDMAQRGPKPVRPPIAATARRKNDAVRVAHMDIPATYRLRPLSDEQGRAAGPAYLPANPAKRRGPAH